MFEQTLIGGPETRRERAIVAALIVQTALVAGIGLLPMMGVPSLGPMRQMLALPPIQMSPKPIIETTVQTAPRSKPWFNLTSLKPSSEHVAVVDLQPMGLPAPLVGGGSSGAGGDSIGVPFGEIRVAPPVKAATPPEVKPKQPVRLTSVIAESQLVYGPKPVYPRLALMSRSEGTVKLQAIISREGKIENMHVLVGPALLVGAAMEAVRTWRYRPLLLNGEPVEVITEIDVVFTLQH